MSERSNGASPTRIDHAELLRDVARGLAMPQKEIDPKYFYDERGSALFERITELPEYYLTRAERKLLESEIPGFIAHMRPRSLVELGAGGARKTRIILDAMMDVGSGAQYVPVDVSREFLEDSARRLRETYPELEVITTVGDFSRDLTLPEIEGPTLFAFLGSTIGNFEDDAAVKILRHIASHMRAGDRFLLGADLRKDVTTIEAAYNDEAGITAEFNLNVLRVLNREFGADFDLGEFRHRAIYDRDEHRIEMHLDSLRDQIVSIPNIGEFPLVEGESIRTELSLKYDRSAINTLFRRAGICLDDWITDSDELFALAVGGVANGRPTRLDRSLLRASVEKLFAPKNGQTPAMTIGAELELIPFETETRRPIPIVENGRTETGSLRILQRIGHRLGWTEISAGDDPPSWSLPGGARLSFEPGGQIELSSAPLATASGLIRDLQCTAQLLLSAFASAGGTLEAVGVDPYNGISDVSLQLHRPRYERMTRYFDSIGPSGLRMMRQSASLQINVEVGAAPNERWVLLNALAPYVTAIFANSPDYAGKATGNRSYRAHLWRTLDPTRTGLPVNTADPIGAYLDFALAAGAMMRDDAGAYESFEAWMRRGDATLEDWELHLSTLFPEVRPRHYFELRSVDAIDPEFLAAPIALIVGLVYDDASARSASDMLTPVKAPSLEIAGRDGLANAQIREMSTRLTDLALAGCESLGNRYISSSDVSAAARFFDRYTRQGHSPGDDWS
jgi:dimethylhistidine N-methyltransferase/glutamate--cysteine ligase